MPSIPFLSITLEQIHCELEDKILDKKGLMEYIKRAFSWWC